jgi:hypothetical protein
MLLGTFIWWAAPVLAQDHQRPEQVIGAPGSMGQEQMIFDRVESLAVLPTGALLVVEPRSALVRSIDPANLETEEIGRRGRGPGEFESPRFAGVVGDALWIWDPPLGRMTRFGPGFEVAETVTLPFMLGAASALRGGGFVGTRGRARQGERTWLLVFEPDGETPRDSLLLGTAVEQVRVQSGGFGTVTRQPWADNTIWAASPVGEGFVTVERPASGAAEIRVSRYDGSGRRIRTDTIKYEPVEMTRAYVREFAGLMAEAFAEGATRQGIPIDRREHERALLDALHIPDRFPPVTFALMGSAGEVYLRRYLDPGSDLAEYWILSPEGSVSRASFPKDFRLSYVSKSDLWGIRRASDATEYLVRYRRR